ncbi:hypothetical protein AVEN_253783-1 [Araneus ventricosus]|uniref:Uncharacterized protein n=1 Tax=Araneus ventricosus TaxID=182803 RepID=A0A4Y2J159_ARAVE|nr:hypothetical protein AVEN_253783-1 [Araneus ventricosus]
MELLIDGLVDGSIMSEDIPVLKDVEGLKKRCHKHIQEEAISEAVELQQSKWREEGTVFPGHPDVCESDALGRVYTVHPNNAECFYPRLLLHTIREPTSFTDLKTVEARVCETYREACLKLGLLEDDQHWDSTLKEASLTRFPPQFRDLFALIITTCAPTNPSSLWQTYKNRLSEDILQQKRRENPDIDLHYISQIYNETLILLENKCL